MVQPKTELVPSNQSSGLSKTTSRELSREVEQENNEAAVTAVATKARAEVESALIMARKFPRHELDIRTKVLNTCRIYSFADKAKYKKPQGKKLENGKWVQNYVIGPSIRLAEELFRQWGNITYETNVLYENAKVRIISCRAMDLQTLATSTSQFIIEKTVERKSAEGRVVVDERVNSNGEKISIVVATEDEVFSKQNNIGSKYRRNLIIQLIPTYLLQDALTAIDDTIKAGIKENPDRAKLDMLDRFAKFGILPADIEKYLGHPVAQIMPDEIQELMDIFTAIVEKETTWEDVLEEKLKPAEAPAAAHMPPAPAFKAGDASTHQAVQEKVGDSLPKLKLEIEFMVKKLGKEKVDKVIGSYGFATIEEIQSIEAAKKILGELELS